jgi:hypothetical protein
MKKRSISGVLLCLLIVLSFVTNPTEQDYLEYSTNQYGESPPDHLDLEIEVINFFLFQRTPPLLFMNMA